VSSVSSRLIQSIIIIVLLVGSWQVAEGGYIKAKAWLAQYLLQSAWETARAGGERVRPWPWADTWPVARLQVPRLGVDQIILAGASGRTLAFGPGHLAGTAEPGGVGNSVVSAHRDTHFRFLQQLQPGDRLELITLQGARLTYAVASAEVHDKSDLWLLDQGQYLLTLITCYPFDALLPGGPERYVIRAVPLQESAPSVPRRPADGLTSQQRIYM